MDVDTNAVYNQIINELTLEIAGLKQEVHSLRNIIKDLEYRRDTKQ